MGRTDRGENKLDDLAHIGGADMKRKIIEASPGMILTNGSIYGKKIFLAEDLTAEQFKEITKAEYNEILQNEEQAAQYEAATINE